MKYEISPSIYQVRLYGRHADNYDSSFDVHVYGDRGFAYNIHGPGFYELIPLFFEDICRDLGVVQLEGYMVPAHARACRIKMRNVADVVIDPAKVIHNYHGRSMSWVTVRIR